MTKPEGDSALFAVIHDDRVGIGRAMPVLEADFFGAGETSGHAAISAKPFGLMFQALDSLEPDDVYAASGSSPRYALWVR